MNDVSTKICKISGEQEIDLPHGLSRSILPPYKRQSIEGNLQFVKVILDRLIPQAEEMIA